MARRPAIDWAAVEATLVRLTTADVARFAAAHPGEPFYGFAFDCNSRYGEVGLCLNTEAGLAESRAAPDPNAEFFAALDKKLGLPEHPAPAAPAGGRPRWELGGWLYQGFNGPAFDRGWRRVAAAVTAACDGEPEDPRTFLTPTQARFLESACRALVTLERRDAFAPLPRVRRFATLAIDHDETERAARARLARVRRTLPAT
ncbi:MAG TPA: DUF4303 domain-containing protein [Humisphaera sp.]